MIIKFTGNEPTKSITKEPFRYFLAAAQPLLTKCPSTMYPVRRFTTCVDERQRVGVSTKADYAW